MPTTMSANVFYINYMSVNPESAGCSLFSSLKMSIGCDPVLLVMTSLLSSNLGYRRTPFIELASNSVPSLLSPLPSASSLDSVGLEFVVMAASGMESSELLAILRIAQSPGWCSPSRPPIGISTSNSLLVSLVSSALCCEAIKN